MSEANLAKLIPKHLVLGQRGFMGIYLNPGNANFKSILSREIYVDKTMLIAETNRFIDKGNKFVCVSRPRRFGKTIAGNMLAAYYSKGCDSRELFLPYKIADESGFSEKLNRYNVIQIDVNGAYQNTRDKERMIEHLEDKIKKELRAGYPDVEIAEQGSLAEAILAVYAATGDTFVIIMDEYDVLVREQVPGELFLRFLGMLNGLFKDSAMSPAIALAYLTGILPIVRDRVQSRLNNFEEYTILDSYELAEYVGFTSDEVRNLCDRYDMDYEECRSWYDGYRQHGYEIYNPQSVIKAVEKREYDGYWSRTSTYAAIADRISANYEGIKDDVINMLAGESISVNITSYMNTMDSFATRGDIFTYLIHTGYLAYDRETGTCRIPNREVRQEWMNAVEAMPAYSETNRIIQASRELLEETVAGDCDAVASALDASHINVTSVRSYNNEDALQCAIYLAYIYALNEYGVFREVPAGKGVADMVYIPVHGGGIDRPAMIIELKRNGSADSAIRQIRERQYFTCLDGYRGDILFVGISYDEKAKTHSCEIERFTKQAEG